MPLVIYRRELLKVDFQEIEWTSETAWLHRRNTSPRWIRINVERHKFGEPHCHAVFPGSLHSSIRFIGVYILAE